MASEIRLERLVCFPHFDLFSQGWEHISCGEEEFKVCSTAPLKRAGPFVNSAWGSLFLTRVVEKVQHDSSEEL